MKEQFGEKYSWDDYACSKLAWISFVLVKSSGLRSQFQTKRFGTIFIRLRALLVAV
jgi:hypothetical protein